MTDRQPHADHKGATVQLSDRDNVQARSGAGMRDACEIKGQYLRPVILRFGEG